MNTLSNKIINLSNTTYQKVAKKFSVTPNYVGAIARRERLPKRGKGLKIKEHLELLANNAKV